MILVIAEQRDGKLNRATWEADRGGAAAGGRGDHGRRRRAGATSARSAAELRSGRGRRRSSPSSTPALEPYTPDGYTAALAAGDRPSSSPSSVVLPHTYQTRDFAPKLAARLDRALVTDVTAIKPARRRDRVRPPDVPGQADRRRRPAGAGAALRDVPDRRVPGRSGREGRRAGAGRAARRRGRRRRAIRQQPEAPFQEARQAVDLSQAERIVSVGRGIKEPGATSPSRSSWPTRSAPNWRRRVRSATPAGCRWSGRSAAPARPWRRSCTWRSASPAPSSTWSA